jgi:rod shape-determining protein MreC
MGGFLPPAERRGGIMLGVLAAVSLLLLLSGDRVTGTGLRAVGAWLFAPLDRMVLAVDRVVAAWRENGRLHQHIVTLELENAKLRSAGHENRRLRELLDLPPWSTGRLTPVEILALSGSQVPTAATLSAGRSQGVKVGDVLVTSDGLLGRVVESYGGLSRAALITDPASAVACEVDTTGVLGVLRTNAVPRPRLVLTGIPMSDTLKIGQRIVTSGFSRRYPRGVPVGRIVRLGRDPSGLTQDVEIAPGVDLARLRHGFIMTRPQPLEVPAESGP